MTADEQEAQEALEYALAHYGLDPAELTPERELLVRNSSVYRWRLLRLKVQVLMRPVVDAWWRLVSAVEGPHRR